MADIPIVIEDISIKRIYGIQKDDIEDNRKFITAYLIDSLMIKPNPMETVVRQVTDAVYEIRDEYLRSANFSPIARIWETQSQNFLHPLPVFILMLK